MPNGSPPRTQIAVDCIPAVAILTAVFCVFFFHGYEIFQYTLSIDEELMLEKVDLLRFVQRGRWGTIALSWLRTPLPVTHMAAGLMLYGTAFVLLIRQFQVKNWESVIVAAGIFFGFPVLLHAFAFSNLTLTLGMGTLLAVSALDAASEGIQRGFSLRRCLLH